VIASVHIADVGPRAALRLLRAELDPAGVDGLRYAILTTTAPLGAGLLPRPRIGRVGLIAAWQDDAAIDGFLASHPLARQLAQGWHVRLQPTRIYGAWPELPGLVEREQPMDDAEPAAVLTIGRLRLTQTVRFLRASATAERLALRNPSLIASTGLARLPALVATFSLWQSTAAMRAYVLGDVGPGHLDAIHAHAAQPFHHESAFIRFRPYAARGSWDGRDPLAAAHPAPAPEPLGVSNG
jgi:hypothetical protein